MFDQVWFTQDGRYACLKKGEWWQYGEAPQSSTVWRAKVVRPAPALEGAFVDLGDSAALLRYGKGETPLKPSETVLVYESEPAKGSKLSVVKTNPSLAGRYAVYLPKGEGLRFAKGYASSQQKWTQALQDVVATLPGGWILRSAAEGADSMDVVQDMRSLQDTWRKLLAGDQLGPVYRSPDVDGQVYAKAAKEIWVEDEALQTRLAQAYPMTPVKVVDDLSLRYDQTEREIKPLLDRKVRLSSGVELVFDTTEAATVVDVDSGGFPLSGDPQASAREVNRIAAKALVRLLSLREISGVVLIDFVSVDETGRKDLMAYLTDFADLDERLRVVDMTALGIVELTRKG